ncbi:MAG TPA: hypothetical protein G4N92_07005 [Anaerolineae bacterium]|nr:hypothetical protein [Anaerolineae bacterium]
MKKDRVAREQPATTRWLMERDMHSIRYLRLAGKECLSAINSKAVRVNPH